MNTYARFFVCLLTLVAVLPVVGASSGQPATPAGRLVIDDFEAYTQGGTPAVWKFFSRKARQYEPAEEFMAEDERFFVVQERGNKFLRGYTDGEAQRITRPLNEGGFAWNLKTHPRLRWDWRALQLPVGASERERNDTGGALYVTFGTDWLGRPKSIKYTYSSTLPVGTVVSFGRLKVIVVSSGADGLGPWRSIERDVVADYRRVFGEEPPDEPLSLTLWSDSDDTGSVAEVDFDNIVLLP